MTAELWIAVGGLCISALVVAGWLAVLAFNMGQLRQEVRGINRRLDVLNGSVAQNTARSYANQVDIARLRSRTGSDPS